MTLIRDEAGIAKLLDFFAKVLATGGVIGWDIETTPLKDFFYQRCRTIQFGNQVEQYVIDLLAFCEGNSDSGHYQSAPDQLYEAQGYYGTRLTPTLKALLNRLAPVICTTDFLKLGVNLGFEYMMFYWLFGLRTCNFYDCMLAEKCIWAGAHSMKDYHFYSMEAMVARYFGVQIDKQYQESFTLDGELGQGQVDYGALDTRVPFSLRSSQIAIAACGNVPRIDPIVFGDNLTEIVQIENDAIGAFQDMHIHGERIDRQSWLARVSRNRLELASLFTDVLDPIFLRFVGSKTETISDDRIAAAEAAWKALNSLSDAELALKPEIRAAKKDSPESLPLLEAQREALETARKLDKEALKAVCGDLKKKRTRIKNLAAKCEGDALINYNSNKQLIDTLKGFKGLKSLDNLEDDTLEKYQHIPAMAAIRKLHSLSKKIGTYGEAWAQEWVTKPCKQEGWLNPGDGRLHCVFNQYDAETGRSSSEKPNGQNIEKDKAVRACFVADPPDESIRISNCCDADTYHSKRFSENLRDIPCSWVVTECSHCRNKCDTHPEEYVIVTADMSGAELRIIAELADDPVWIGAFARHEDVHSVGTELLYPVEWAEATQPGCAFYALKPDGEPQKKKCKCPGHMILRDDNKATNFLLAYGGGPDALSVKIKKTRTHAIELMALHERKNTIIWSYLAESGRTAKTLMRSFDMFGRRRLFPRPTWERAKEKCKEDKEEKLRHEEDESTRNLVNFTALYNRKPTGDEEWYLTHRLPTSKEIASTFYGMHGSIERQGKNHAIQGTNATIAKLAMGSGHSPDGTPYLWHTLPTYRAKLIKFVHDELVVQCPKQFGGKVAELIGDAFCRAAAEKMKNVVMEFEYNIGPCWQK